MLVRVEVRAEDGRVTPHRLHLDGRRIDIVDVLDQWYGRDYRYVKARGDDGAMYILRFDEIRQHWELVMFVSARGQAVTTPPP
jgi:hypothetical protein